jgi:hypothetical protein
MASSSTACLLALLATALPIAGCDASRPAFVARPLATVAPESAHAPLRTPPHGVQALIGANGAALPPLPEAVPRERSHRTRAGLYATREQAEDLDGDRAGEVIWLELACDGPSAIEQAQDTVATERDARALERDTPVLLSAQADACRASAAWLADRLDDLGHSRVFLVTA